MAEGQSVEQGQVLVELETTSSDADLSELSLRIASLNIDLQRLEAERRGDAQLGLKGLQETLAKQADQAVALFNSRRERLQHQLEDQTQMIAMRQLDIDSLGSKNTKLKERLVLVAEQIDISEDLLRDNLTNRYQHLELLKEANDLELKIDEANNALKAAHHAMAEAQLKRKTLQSSYDEEVNHDLSETRSMKEELEQRLRKVRDELQRRSIRAPVSGIVKTLYISTRGEVLRSGITLLDIVPAGDRLLVAITGGRHRLCERGAVFSVAPHHLQCPQIWPHRWGGEQDQSRHLDAEAGEPYYKVVIQPDAEQFDSGSEVYPFVPGMVLAVQILTGERTVLDYMISPFTRFMDMALKER